MRQIVLDTETTGLNPKEGHKVIEIGCIELVDRRLTSNHRHFYLNPDRPIDEEAVAIHGISNDFLMDKPRFYEIVEEVLQFLLGAELIIHNAAFDLAFLNHELSLLRRNPWGTIESVCQITDTLELARKKHPGQRNSLDALCKRYEVNNAHRQLHGALLDAQILANLYLAMTGGQESLSFNPSHAEATLAVNSMEKVHALKPWRAKDDEVAAHEAYLKFLNRSGTALWQ